MDISRVFINPEERRLRAGWRLLVHSLLLLSLGIVAIVPLVILALFPALFGSLLPGLEIIFQELAALVAITLSVYLARRFFDRRSFASLGLSLGERAAWDILAGIGIAALMMGLIYLIEWSAGWLTLQGFAWQEEALGGVLLQTTMMLGACVIVGWQEELLSRGYHLQNLADGLNLPWGVFLSSLVFSLLHLLNPGAGLQSVLGILAAGLFLGYAYVLTRQLWLPIGLHIGWNFFEGPVFGFPVSGMDFFRLTLHQVDGPTLFTGGKFGPEAGLVLLPALALGTGLMILYVRRYKHE